MFLSCLTPHVSTLVPAFVQMYTEGVSSRAEQLTNQLQNQEAPKPVTSGRRESVRVSSCHLSLTCIRRKPKSNWSISPLSLSVSLCLSHSFNLSIYLSFNLSFPLHQVNLRSVFASGGTSDVCFFCKNRVYVMERLSAEGLFFHRSCFQCDYCSSTLRLASYAYDRPTGEEMVGGALLRRGGDFSE